MSVTCPSTEPAVPAFNQPLFTCPVEVLVMIISHIEDRCDLMSMAQVSEDFHRIIVSKWLDYIHIRCDPLRIDIWQRIASNPYLAARTRSLEIINESVGPEEYNWSACKATPYCNNSEHCRCNTSFPSIIPSFSPPYLDPFVTREAYEKSVLVLGDALKHMTRLRCFRWGLQLPVGYALESLLKSFGKRNDMDEFYLNLGHHDSGPVPFEDDDITGPVNLPLISPLGKFPNITTFCLTINQVPWHHESDSLVDWIVQFTALKHLQLIFEPKPDNFDLLVIWQRAYWPSLVELTLEADIKLFPEFTDDYAPWGGPYFHNPCEESPFSTFLRKHQTIERLRIRTQTNYSGFIQPQTLSRLRSLVLGFVSRASPFDNGFPLDIAQQIEYLECSISAASLPTLLAMTSLRVFNALSMDLEVFERFVEAAPHIQHLHIPYAMWYDYSLIEPSHLADRVVSCLLKLNHLVQLEADFTVNGGDCDLFHIQYLINKIMEHKSLVYINSLTREQWKLALKEAALSESFQIFLPCATLPDIRESAGFYIKNCETYV
ncbi:hypothetical protein BU17DRAFT_70111 [Hysterangium stoloniferum]|nr:hypothetical protein BU17DRAFT_70111 [Hysterangium stoloniferum]